MYERFNPEDYTDINAYSETQQYDTYRDFETMGQSVANSSEQDFRDWNNDSNQIPRRDPFSGPSQDIAQINIAPPSGPPPFIPPRPITPFRVDANIIRNCMRRFTYIWLDNGNEFWMFPIQLGRNSISGFRWGRFGWTFFGVSLDRISSFACI